MAILSNGDTRSGEADAEIDRIKAIVIQNSSGKVKIDEITGTQKDRETVELAVSSVFTLKLCMLGKTVSR